MTETDNFQPQVHAILDPGKVRRSVGGRLENARKQSGFSVEEVAEKLNLPIRHIKNIEADDFARFPAETFVLGYVRNYAKLVGLEEQPLIDLYRELNTPIDSEVESSAEDTEVYSSTQKIPVSLWIFGAFLCAVVWFVLLRPGAQTDEVLPVSSTVQSSVTNAVEPSKMDENNALDSAEVSESLLLQERANNLEVAQTTGDQNLDTGDALAEAPSGQIDAVPPETDINEASQNVTTESGDNVGEEPLSVSDIVIELLGDCWVEISDSDGQRIAFGLYKEGNRIEASGVAPFDVVLGDATVASVSLDGQPVALEIIGNKRSIKTRLSTVQ